MNTRGPTALAVGLLGVAGLLVSCNTPAFQANQIRPIYGWADACNAIKVSGAGFGDDVDVTFDGESMLDLTPAEGELHVGYFVTGYVPPKDLAESAYAEVEVTSGGESDMAADPFYRIACPGAVNPEGIDPEAELAAGTTVALFGCHILDTHVVKLGGEEAALTNASACAGGTDTATFSAPDIADGDWYVGIYDAGGNEIYPNLVAVDDDGNPIAGSECDVSLPAGTSVLVDGDGNPILDDDGNTIDNCAGAMMVSYGTTEEG